MFICAYMCFSFFFLLLIFPGIEVETTTNNLLPPPLFFFLFPFRFVAGGSCVLACLAFLPELPLKLCNCCAQFEQHCACVTCHNMCRFWYLLKRSVWGEGLGDLGVWAGLHCAHHAHGHSLKYVNVIAAVRWRRLVHSTNRTLTAPTLLRALPLSNTLAPSLCNSLCVRENTYMHVCMCVNYTLCSKRVELIGFVVCDNSSVFFSLTFSVIKLDSLTVDYLKGHSLSAINPTVGIFFNMMMTHRTW